MLRIESKPGPGARVTLTVEGSLGDAHLAALREAVAGARRLRRPVRLDLEAVESVGRKSLEYLARLAAPDVRIARCPAYLRRWMARERAARAPGANAVARSRRGTRSVTP